jgi:hypothetical protein
MSFVTSLGMASKAESTRTINRVEELMDAGVSGDGSHFERSPHLTGNLATLKMFGSSVVSSGRL